MVSSKYSGTAPGQAAPIGTISNPTYRTTSKHCAALFRLAALSCCASLSNGTPSDNAWMWRAHFRRRGCSSCGSATEDKSSGCGRYFRAAPSLIKSVLASARLSPVLSLPRCTRMECISLRITLRRSGSVSSVLTSSGFNDERRRSRAFSLGAEPGEPRHLAWGEVACRTITFSRRSWT
jgi:hypothetical protein